jgi:GNAT superfamily N-acetyltransferase
MSNRLEAKTIVRPATFDDILGVRDTIEMARTLSEQWLPPAEYPFCLQYTFELMNRGLVWVAEKDKKVVGVIMLDTYTWPWSRKFLFLENVHFWVEPKHRKDGVGQRLLDCAKKHALLMKMQFRPRITYGATDGDLIDRWMRSQGFVYVGGNFAPRA